MRWDSPRYRSGGRASSLLGGFSTLIKIISTRYESIALYSKVRAPRFDYTCSISYRTSMIFASWKNKSCVLFVLIVCPAFFIIILLRVSLFQLNYHISYLFQVFYRWKSFSFFFKKPTLTTPKSYQQINNLETNHFCSSFSSLTRMILPTDSMCSSPP